MTVSDLTVPRVPDAPQLPPISIVIGHVRIATSYTWTGARIALRKDIEESYPLGMFPRDLVAQRRAYELVRLISEPDGTPGSRLLMTSGTWAWGDTIRYAQEGEHGLTSGDLCLVHDYANGCHRSAWTVDVKAVIIAVTPHHKVTVRITGESLQFDRNQVLTIPSSFIRPRAKRGVR